MGYAVLVVLAVVWAMGLLPGILRRHHSVEHTVTAFSRSMALIAPHSHQAGRRVLVLDDPESLAGSSRRGLVRQRRRQAVQNLGLGTVFVVFTAGALGFWPVSLVAALGYLGYLLALREVQHREEQRRRKVLRLAGGPVIGAPRLDGEWSLARRRAG